MLIIFYSLDCKMFIMSNVILIETLNTPEWWVRGMLYDMLDTYYYLLLLI